jgi:ubiquinone/menaquinone biosynthesis C-methylase UbiE
MSRDHFADIPSQDYNLFKKIMPYSDELQDKLGQIVRNYSGLLQNKIISVVEGGPGTGLTTLRLLEADKRITVIGIDNEETYLKQASAALSEYGDRVQFRNKDLLEALTEIPDGSIDIFASAWMIHNVPPAYRAQLFPEIARILKTGGLFVNCDKLAQNDESLHLKDLEIQCQILNFFDEFGRPDLKKKWKEHWDDDERIKFTEDEQVKLLRFQNFGKVFITDRKEMDAIIIGILDSLNSTT